MGLGTGVICERCEEQISYDVYNYGEYYMKSRGDDHDLCGPCVKERKKESFDKNYENKP